MCGKKVFTTDMPAPANARMPPSPIKKLFHNRSTFNTREDANVPSFILLRVDFKKMKEGIMYMSAEPSNAPVTLTTNPASLTIKASDVRMPINILEVR